MERTAVANGWKVLQLRHGPFRESLFARPGGAAFKKLFAGGLSDYEFQMLLFKNDAAEIRKRANEKAPDSAKFVRSLADADLVRAFGDLGGHSIEKLIEAYEKARNDDSAPYLIIAHTIKGFGLECSADPSNHSALPSDKEMLAILSSRGLSPDDPFALFAEKSLEGQYLSARRDRFRAGIEEHVRLKNENRAKVR